MSVFVMFEDVEDDRNRVWELVNDAHLHVHENDAGVENRHGLENIENGANHQLSKASVARSSETVATRPTAMSGRATKRLRRTNAHFHGLENIENDANHHGLEYIEYHHGLVNDANLNGFENDANLHGLENDENHLGLENDMNLHGLENNANPQGLGATLHGLENIANIANTYGSVASTSPAKLASNSDASTSPARLDYVDFDSDATTSPARLDYVDSDSDASGDELLRIWDRGPRRDPPAVAAVVHQVSHRRRGHGTPALPASLDLNVVLEQRANTVAEQGLLGRPIDFSEASVDNDELAEALMLRIASRIETARFYIGVTSDPVWRWRGGASDRGVMQGHSEVFECMTILAIRGPGLAAPLERLLIASAKEYHGARCANRATDSRGCFHAAINYLYVVH